MVAGLSVAGAATALGSGQAGQRGGSTALPFVLEQPVKDAAQGPADTGLDVLSDTQGVNFDPYLKGVLTSIHDTWLPLLPPEARPPKLEQGDSVVRFTIGPTGKILAMHLDGGTRDTNLDNAAWGAISRVGHFPALPEGFTGPSLQLRIHFRVNMDAPTRQAAVP